MEDIQHLEQKIDKLHSEIMSAFLDYTHAHDANDMMNSLEQEIHIDFMKENIVDLAERLYMLGLTYLELKGLPLMRTKFENEIGALVKNKAEMIGGTYIPEIAEVHSKFGLAIWSYMESFPAFDSSNSEEQLRKRIGLGYLESILESTSVILKDLGKKPKKETEVSDAVKFVTKATFPSASFPSISFIKTATHYIPDVLVPSLGCAVEYKYAENEKKLSKTMDEILIDVKAYDNHPQYKLFYAVFYVKVGTVAKKRFDKIWSEKEFPQNWKGVFVEGI